jgi:hypothetical protein
LCAIIGISAPVANCTGGNGVRIISAELCADFAENESVWTTRDGLRADLDAFLTVIRSFSMPFLPDRRADLEVRLAAFAECVLMSLI